MRLQLTHQDGLEATFYVAESFARDVRWIIPTSMLGRSLFIRGLQLYQHKTTPKLEEVIPNLTLMNRVMRFGLEWSKPPHCTQWIW